MTVIRVRLFAIYAVLPKGHEQLVQWAMPEDDARRYLLEDDGLCPLVARELECRVRDGGMVLVPVGRSASPDLATIRRFLALPPEALPQADIVDEDWGDAWTYLRRAAAGHPSNLCLRIRLRAARDGWRDGQTVEV